MVKRILLNIGVFGFLLSGCNTLTKSTTSHDGKIVISESIDFEEMAPFVQMATVTGDKTVGAHGTFGRFKAEASSPPHTHSGAYHGVVISGTMTNPFTNSEDQTHLSEGSYWYVPAGQEHVTSCISDEPCLFYFHAEDAFDFTPQEALGDRSSPLARLLPTSDLDFQEIAPFVQMAGAYGDRGAGAHGTFGLMIANGASPKHTHTGSYHGVVLSGTMTNPFGNDSDSARMTAGSYWFVPAGVPHVTACVSDEPCNFYFHAESAFDFTPVDQ